MDNIERVAFLMKKLFSAYSHKASTEAMIATYLDRLQSIPIDELGPVIDQCLDECKFLPTIAEIKERHTLITRRVSQETAAEQWGRVQQAMREVGYVQTPRFRDPITAQIVKQWGWENLCASETPMPDRAHFLKMYDAISQRQEQIARLTPASRQLAEQRAGLQPIAEVLQLPDNGTNHVNQN